MVSTTPSLPSSAEAAWFLDAAFTTCERAKRARQGTAVSHTQKQLGHSVACPSLLKSASSRCTLQTVMPHIKKHFTTTTRAPCGNIDLPFFFRTRKFTPQCNVCNASHLEYRVESELRLAGQSC